MAARRPTCVASRQFSIAVLLNTLAASSIAAADSCAAPRAHTGLGGENLNSSYADDALNVSMCCETCNGLSACEGWTLNSAQRMCFLKANCTAFKQNPKCVASGLRSPLPTPVHPTPAPGEWQLLRVQ